jgi:hypothetical protein
MRARYVISVAAGIAFVGAGIAGATLSVSQRAGPPETIPPEEAQIPEGLPEQAVAGMAKADANRAATMTFVDAMRAWTACVAEQAPLHDESTGEFDPEAACGPKPTPALPEDGDDGDENDNGSTDNGGGSGGAAAGRGDQAEDFGKQTAGEAQTGGEDFGQQTAGEAQTGGEDFGQQTVGEAQPHLGGPPGP